MTADPDAATDESPDPYPEFVDHVEQYYYVQDATQILSWDQQVMMPPGGTPARSKQKSALSTIQHDLLTDEQLTAWLDSLETTDLTGAQGANVREIQRKHDRASSVPRDLVEDISEATSNALQVWESAKADADFGAFEDTLREILELKREYAAAIDPDRDPYAVLFEEYEPYLGLDTAEEIMADLRDGLVPLIDDVADSDVTLDDPFSGTYPEADQRALVEAALDTLAYDRDRGRLDTAPHPFSLGTAFDARVTTRFSPEDPMEALTSTIHEFGHASYTQGLPQEHYGTPLGDNRDLVVHESQSRLWENHVGRSEAFWERFGDRMAEHLGVKAGTQAWYEAANRVDPENVIRTEADELTYHLHIALRFEIERDLVSGDLDVSEVPGVWNEKMREYLGVEPEDDGEGCLQDIHWTHGSFGYFPTYSLGSVLAAQLYEAASEDLAIRSQVREGTFGPLMDWLREEVHRHGARYRTPELIERATGGALSADPFLDYARDKYGELYAL